MNTLFCLTYPYEWLSSAPTGIKYDLTTIDTFLDTCRELESTERQHCLLWRQPLDRSLIVYI